MSQCYCCGCIVLILNFVAPPINNYVCTNACLNRSKPLMSAQQPFVVLLAVLGVVAFISEITMLYNCNSILNYVMSEIVICRTTYSFFSISCARNICFSGLYRSREGSIFPLRFTLFRMEVCSESCRNESVLWKLR